jgi:Rps23 Pro-64 3,4-dihydroxylase Tpa1-like proline 4-hydroxylase
MIKIYKNFFDSDCLKYIEDSIVKSKNTTNLRTSYPSNNWQSNIIHESAPIIIYDLNDADILLKPLKEILDIKKEVHFMIYYWPVGSYIPWHNDAHASVTATVYCNRYWDRDWGGLFLYEKGDNILAEVPEWNKIVIQTDKDWHSTTSVTKPYYCPIAVQGGGGHDMIPDIRTTIQFFSEL